MLDQLLAVECIVSIAMVECTVYRYVLDQLLAVDFTVSTVCVGPAPCCGAYSVQVCEGPAPCCRVYSVQVGVGPAPCCTVYRVQVCVSWRQRQDYYILLISLIT